MVLNACAEASDEGDASAVAQTQQTIVATPYDDVGYGIIPSTNAFSGEGKQLCLPHRGLTVDAVKTTATTGTIISSATEVEARLGALFNDRLDAHETVVDEIRDTLVKIQNSNDDFSAAVIVGLIRTVDRSAQPYWTDKPDASKDPWDEKSICDPADPASPDNLDEFVERCGTHFVKREELGGIVAFVADITHLDQSKREHLSEMMGAELGLGVTSLNQSLEATLARVNSDFGVLDWHTYLWGLTDTPGLPPFNWNDPPNVLANWLTYIQDIFDEVDAALASGKFNDPSYADVLKFHTEPYGTTHLDWCKIPVDQSGLACMQDSESAAQRILDPAGELHSYYERVDWMLNNPGYVDWQDGNPQDAIDAFEDWRSYFLSCRAKTELYLNTCFEAPADALAQGMTPAQTSLYVCRECTAVCTMDDLQIAYDMLPNATVNSYGRDFVPFSRKVRDYDANSNAASLKPSDDWLCALGGVSGYFENLGDSVSLIHEGSFATGQPRWKASVVSTHVVGTSPNANTVSGTYYCSPRSRFEGDGTNVMKSEDFQDYSVINNEVVGYLSNDRERAYMLSGISGRLQGLGERAWVGHENPYVNRVRYKVRSMIGDIKAHFIGFGMVDPTNGEMEYYFDSSAEQEFGDVLAAQGGEHSGFKRKMLGPLDRSFCYLTEISGRFDGGRERVQIVADGTHWYLELRAAPTKDVRAKARCVRYRQ
ncbi:hypothetical protein DV096_11020 [Bradymonadaceae bacterium TMQ3]|nr:hypothetical protein DV096_11020 [Bradymonadaceae bacterium TMQ3]TXC76004.1 hypothetical protein FRC91_10930 [Bradymonadales bacterium TMQ1]